MNFSISKERLIEGMYKMNSFGTRLTGSKGHNDFIKWIKDEIADMGIDVYSDPFHFRRWEEKKSSIEIIDGENKINIPVSSAYPYSGETTKSVFALKKLMIKKTENFGLFSYAELICKRFVILFMLECFLYYNRRYIL